MIGFAGVFFCSLEVRLIFLYLLQVQKQDEWEFTERDDILTCDKFTFQISG